MRIPAYLPSDLRDVDGEWKIVLLRAHWELPRMVRGAGATKPIAAGSTIVVSTTSTQGRGVMFADVARHGNEISRIRYFSG